jgi:hypothetical protein
MVIASEPGRIHIAVDPTAVTTKGSVMLPPGPRLVTWWPVRSARAWTP